MTEGGKKERIILKIIVLGSSNVGKSSLIKRFTTGKFTDNRVATVGSDFMTKIIDMMGMDVVLQIWDTAGICPPLLLQKFDNSHS
jgi:small GTP-binding protein